MQPGLVAGTKDAITWRGAKVEVPELHWCFSILRVKQLMQLNCGWFDSFDDWILIEHIWWILVAYILGKFRQLKEVMPSDA